MDIIDLLEKRIINLPKGEYSSGIEAVLQHIKTAVRHFENGKNDDTLFTDAIYRTNQAFEGSLKEAYRVLEGKDPKDIRPYDIENYFVEKGIFKERVLNQFKNYRTEWRNPSTHDYRLNFNEDEALLAIVSVTAFALVLTDQIAEKLSYLNAFESSSQLKPNNNIDNLADAAASLLLNFKFLRDNQAADEPPNGYELVGAVAGYLAAMLPPDIDVATGVRIEHGGYFIIADVVLRRGNETVIIEIKRKFLRIRQVESNVIHLSGYMAVGGIKEAILFFYSHEDKWEIEKREYPVLDGQARIIAICPVGAG